MSYRRLFVWVEGQDDERFFEQVLKAKLEAEYDLVKLIQYSGMTAERMRNLQRSITKMGADYLFVTDMDLCPCATSRKEKCHARYPFIDPSRFVVVGQEIEAWYLAGLSRRVCADMRLRGVAKLSDTDTITKEEFDRLTSGLKGRRITVMLQLLEKFSYNIAITRNSSLAYFARKFLK